MKKFLGNVILVIIVIFLVNKYHSRFSLQFPTWDNLVYILETIFPSAPCSKPIPYNIINFDQKFNISKEYFLSALSDAEAIWEKPFGKQLFTYEKEDTSAHVLKVNLIYDYRQEATSKLSTIGIVVKNDKASYDALRTQFTNLQSKYNTLKDTYSVKVKNFNLTQKNYNDEVAYWNDRGGAPKKEFDKLNATKVALDTQFVDLKNTEAELNTMLGEMNSMVVVLNRLAGELNLSVEQYNTTNVSRGETFEEGVYIENGVSREIDIYEFSNRRKLVHVLAHELGHALGLEHVDDAKAIMYKFNQGNAEILTKADLDALEAKCGAK